MQAAPPTVHDNLPRDAAVLEENASSPSSNHVVTSLSAALSAVVLSPVSFTPPPRAH